MNTSSKLVKVTLKSGKVIEVMEREVEGLRKARVLLSKAEEKKLDEAKEKEDKETGETKEEKETGETKAGPITHANFRGNL